MRWAGWRRGVAWVAALAGVGLGCGVDETPPASRGVRELRQSLVPFHVAPEWVAATEGDVEMKWVRVAGEPRRALECAADCRMSIRTGRFRGARLEVTASLQPASGGARRFEVRASGARLWSAELQPGESRAIQVPLPDAETVDLVIAGAAEVPARALWLSPFFAAEREGPAAQPGAANVVLVTSDTTRQDELSCYGGPVPTPALERLAAQGVVFDDAHSVAFGTNPSHASLMTSRHAARHGVIHNRAALGPGPTTLAEVLGDHGYATAAFVSAAVLNGRSGLARGFDVYDDSLGLERPGDLTVHLFGRWLRERRPGPFFAWIHLYDAHQPYAPRGAEPVPEIDALIARTNTNGTPGFIDPVAIRETAPDQLPAVERVARERYRAEIAFVDAQVAAIRRQLERAGVFEDTLFVFTADHGENFLDRGTDVAYNHAGVRADVSRIPLILRLPGGGSPGRSDALVGNLDVAPTIVAVLGIASPPDWSGVPLLGPDGRVEEEPRDALILEGSHRREIGVRTRDWLYREVRPDARSPRILAVQGFAPDAPFELYAKATDPEERQNVVASDPPALAGLRERVARFERSAAARPRLVPVDPEHARALEALGYVELEPDEPSGN